MISLLLPSVILLLSVLPSRGAALVDFQVAQPPVVPLSVQQCTIQVLQRDFAFSYGRAEVVQLAPPTECGPPGSWAAITLNLTVTSNGTQYDRLGIFTFQNVEIWRTSTPEPTIGDGIIWTYVKDVTPYLRLFANPGTFIFQLDNLITPHLDGIYSTVVHATYYASSIRNPPAKKPDLVIALSTLANSTGSDASVPPEFSINVTLPRNTIKVFAELFASGNGNEEFWYANAPNQFLPSIPPGTTFGQGPFREVRLLIDGQIAGVAFPYPVIFTGGIAPSLWRPITSYGAIDLPTYFMDVTPFVPLLTDGSSHQFTIDVVSAEADHTILQNWYVSGSLQVITDSSSEPTTGKMITYHASPFADSSSSGSVRTNEVNVSVTASRKIYIEADILSGSGHLIRATWSQDLSYMNNQVYVDNATTQLIRQTAFGHAVGLQNGVPTVIDDFSYPLAMDIHFLNPDLSSWNTHVDHSYDRIALSNPLRLETAIKQHQIADGFFELNPRGNFGNGTSNNTFEYVDVARNTYNRQVDAALNAIILDEEGGTLARNGQYASISSSSGIFSTFPGVMLPGGRGLSQV